MYTDFVKNVTISLDEKLLEQVRERAQTMGKSLNEYVRDLFDEDVNAAHRASIQASFDYVDRLGLHSSGNFLTRDQANERP